MHLFPKFIIFLLLISGCLKSTKSNFPESGQAQSNLPDLDQDKSNRPASGEADAGATADLYERNCSACHGSLKISTKQGRSFAQIKQALTDIPQMAHLSLTDDEIQKISEELNILSSPGEEEDRSADEIYMTTCAKCHGDLKYSDKLGASTESLVNALASVPAMRGIKLSEKEIAALVRLLVKKSSPLNFKPILASREYIAAKMKYLYAADNEADIVNIIDTTIRTRLAEFGGPCKIYVDVNCPITGSINLDAYDPKVALEKGIERAPFLANSLNAPINPDVNTSRLGFILQACSKIHRYESAIKTVLARSSLTADSDPSDYRNIRKLWEAINPIAPFPEGVGKAFQDLVSKMRSEGFSVLSQWKIISEQICSAGLIDVL